MAVRPTGIATNDSDALIAANRIEINPSTVIQVTEVSISGDQAPNSTLAPTLFKLMRLSAAGTGGTAGTIVALQDDLATALGSAYNEDVDGTLGTPADVLHGWHVPSVSGIIWVAAPGREFDCKPAEFIALQHAAAIPATVVYTSYVIWQE